MTMQNYISTYVLLAWFMKINGQLVFSDDSAVKTCEENLKPTVQLLHMLSSLALKTNNSFTIYTEEHVAKEIWDKLRSGCSEERENTCFFKLLGHFKATISVVKKENQHQEANQHLVDISLDLISETPEEPPRITDVCKNLISSIQLQCKPCPTCPASSFTNCDTVCSTVKTTAAVTKTKTPTPAATTTTASSESHIDNSLPQDTTKECLQASTVVIASFISFIAGGFCTIAIAFVIRYFRNRQKRIDSNEGSTTVGNAPLDDKAVASPKDNMQRMEMTYETLKGKTCDDEKAVKEHVYHGLGTHLESNKKPEVTDKEENISKEDFRDNFQHKNSQTGDHVYNALEIKEHADLYKNARAEAYSEHTYTGLANREDEGSVPLDESTGNSGTNDRSNEGHYFILENTNGNETRALGGVEEQKSNIDEKTEDGLKDGDHDYFNLEKMGDSDLPTHKVKQNDDVSIGETEENTYHILEKV
ncbi:uncharacterized protein LOC132744819 isoform X2 [Ruditapes philippinarum]|uniref:uncharacterized protein LOC132744819 isoform X2 n=1 Tax=Ruditapes philippinarum TaxID=129788 RepID=UPI00295AE450|nr:uncharacterized protein LOC132744819 isoform X2 [Ruditapes philippinarum]